MGIEDWKDVTSRKHRHSKDDEVLKISKSVFMTNFPESISARDLWKSCSVYGMVVDVFIPKKIKSTQKINVCSLHQDLNLSNEEDNKLEPNLYNTSRVASDLEGASSSQASDSTKEATQEKLKVFSSRVILDLNLSNAEDKKLEPNLYNTSRVTSDLDGAREPTCKKKVAGCLSIWTPTATTLLHYPFEVATDASGIGIGAGLQQDGHRIVYLSKALAPKHQTLSTYENEFLAIMFALEKWRGYLLDSHFIIKTDHYNLKYLLDQRITTPAQMKALPKLKRFDYEVKYKKGVNNVAADALSRVQNKGQLITTIVVTIPNEIFTRIAASFLQLLQSRKLGKKHYTWTNGQLLRKNKLIVGKNKELRMDLWLIFTIVQWVGILV
nr:putative mitochondrial protein [Tanacetum cinerariifolium]